MMKPLTDEELERLNSLEAELDRVKKFERSRFEQRRKNAVIALVGSLGVLTATLGLMVSSYHSLRDAYITQEGSAVSRAEFRNAIDAAYARGLKNGKATVPSTATQKQFDNLDARLSAIESSIGGKADVVLSVPLLRKDVDAENVRIENVKESLTAQINQAYTLIYFLGGFLLTGAVAVIGAAASQLFKKQPTFEVLDGGRADS